MAKPGPKGMTEQQKWLRGYTRGPRPESNASGSAAQGQEKPPRMPRRPAYFGKHAGKLWRELGADLLANGLLTQSDLAAFELLCSAYEQCRLANEALAEHGPLIPGTRGTLVRNPAGIQLRESSALFLKLADRFALTPAMAQKLGLDLDT